MQHINIKDVRYKNQNGLFTLYPKPWIDDFDKISVKFIIPAPAKSNIINKLMKIGFSHSFIMPSLDSLCKDIEHIYRLQYSYAMK